MSPGWWAAIAVAAALSLAFAVWPFQAALPRLRFWPGFMPTQTSTAVSTIVPAGGAAGVPLDVLRIGHLDGDYHDPRCAWLRHRGIASDGAILVRPDRFIAWRSPACGEPRAALAAALSQILARPVDAPVASAV